MGETRDPSLGGWAIFEGDEPITQADAQYPRPINRTLEWPLTLRVWRIVDRVWTMVDVTVDEDFTVRHVGGTVNLDDPDDAGGGG